MLEVKMAIYEYLTLTFYSLTLIWEIVFHTVKTPQDPKCP